MKLLFVKWILCSLVSLCISACASYPPLVAPSPGMPGVEVPLKFSHEPIIVHVTGDNGATPAVNGAEVTWDGQFVGLTDGPGIIAVYNEAYGKSHLLQAYRGDYGLVQETVKLTAGVRDVTIDLGPRLR